MTRFVTLLFLIVSFGMAQESGEVIMTELLWNPASSEGTTATQIIEIANTTANPINLNGWTIDDEDADGPNTLPNVTLPAYAIAVICGGPAADYNSAFGPTTLVISLSDEGQTMFNMSNTPSATSEIIQLRDAGGNLVDEVNYDDASPWPGDPNGVSNYLNLPKDQMTATTNNDGANWALSADGVDGGYLSTTNTTWDAVETTSFGNIAGDQALPVELVSFVANAGDGQVTLRWSTASELENQGFEILRSEGEAEDFRLIDSYTTNSGLRGAGTSNMAHEYSFVDKDVFNGVTYSYKLVDVDNNGVRTEHGPVSATPMADIADPGSGIIPAAFALYQNSPNPFNPSTTITFDVPASTSGPVKATLAVYNLLGQKVITLFNGEIEAGSYSAQWNGRNSNGLEMPSGIYIYRLSTVSFIESRRMVLMK